MKCKLNVMNKAEWSYRCLDVGWALPISYNELVFFPFFLTTALIVFVGTPTSKLFFVSH